MKIAILGVSIAATAFAAPALADYYTVRQPSVAYTVWGEPSGPVTVLQARRWCAFEGMAFSDGATNRLGQVCDRGSWRYFGLRPFASVLPVDEAKTEQDAARGRAFLGRGHARQAPSCLRQDRGGSGADATRPALGPSAQ